MDKTGGKTNRWSCAANCYGGTYIATADCNCACIKGTPCSPITKVVNAAAESLAVPHFAQGKQISGVKKYGACKMGTGGIRNTCDASVKCCAQVKFGNWDQTAGAKSVHMCFATGVRTF